MKKLKYSNYDYSKEEIVLTVIYDRIKPITTCGWITSIYMKICYYDLVEKSSPFEDFTNNVQIPFKNHIDENNSIIISLIGRIMETIGPKEIYTSMEDHSQKNHPLIRFIHLLKLKDINEWINLETNSNATTMDLFKYIISSFNKNYFGMISDCIENILPKEYNYFIDYFNSGNTTYNLNNIEYKFEDIDKIFQIWNYDRHTTKKSIHDFANILVPSGLSIDIVKAYIIPYLKGKKYPLQLYERNNAINYFHN